MRAKDQLYQYVEKRKQKIIDQYDRTLERINLSKGFESLISLMGDREMLLSIYGKSYDHNIKEILDIFSCIVDEMYQDNELFQNTTKEITHGCVIYSKGKYSIEFHSPVDWQGITVRYHGIIKPFMADAEKDYLKRLYKVKELTQKVIDKKNLKAFIDLAHLLYEKPYHTKNLITHIKRYFKVYHSIHDGLLRKTMIAIETGEERKRKIEKDTEISELEKKIQATVLAMEKANVAKVTVDRYVHPGTCISVNGMKTQVQELEQHVEYARRGNGIIVYHIDEA